MYSWTAGLCKQRMWCRPAGHRRKWWRMVSTWYAQGLLQQEAWNHRAQKKREGERAGKEKNKERDMPYSTSLHTYFLTRARKQEVDCITNKHREQEGGRRESFATLTEDVVCATHLRAEREPQTSLTHTDTHVGSPPPGFIAVWSGLVGDRSQAVTTPHPVPIPPFRWSRLLSPPRFYSHNSCHRRGPRQPHTNTHVLSPASHCGKFWQFVTSTSPKNEGEQRSHTLGCAFMQTAYSDLQCLLSFSL